MTGTSERTLGANGAIAHFQRGHAAQQGGRAAEAIAAYRTALIADPQLAPAQFNLGQLLLANGAYEEASRCFAAAARLRPEAPDAWIHFGVARERLGDLDQASFGYERASALAPHQGVGHFNLGNVRRQQGRLDEARQHFEAAEQLEPGAAEVLLNLGNVLRELGEFERSIGVLERAMAAAPNAAEAEWNLALARLALGQLEEGWRGYEARWARAGLTPERGLPWPLWRGEPVGGTRILVWREQGLGDELLFATCLPDLIASGAEVTVAVDPRLVGMMARAFPEARVIAEGDWGAGPFDFHLPMGNLPRYFRRRQADFRSRWSFLVPERAAIAKFADRLRAVDGTFRVGLCWRSGLRSSERSRLYPELTAFAGMLRTPGVAFVSLQYDDAEDELQAVERQLGIRIHRWAGDDLRDDLESVIALIWNLDLVITAPTAVSSLAGAVGVETWQVDPGTDWTLFGAKQSPWFPAIRAYSRAPRTTQWEPLLDQVATDLADRVGAAAHVHSNGSER